MAKSRTGNWVLLTLLVVAGLVLTAIPGMRMFMEATATKLHPNAKEVPTVSQVVTLPKWNTAVEQGRQAVRTELSEKNLAAISVAVGIGGNIVWAEGFGFADIESRAPVTPKHRFRIGTASIVLTSAAAGLLYEDGRLKLDDEIQKYVPVFPKKQWPVTVRQVMGHMAGIPSDSGDESPLLGQHCERPVDGLKHFGEDSLLFEPGKEYRYSRFGWILVSAAMEAAAEKPFLTFMREKIFEPLGMHDTVADPSRADDADESKKSSPDQITFYFPRFAADPGYGLDVMRELDYSCYAGSSGFLSTPSDMVRFGMAVNGGELLKRDTVQMLQASQRLPSGEETGYGLGWDLETVTLGGEQVREAGHNGDSLGGMVSSLVTIPERGIVVSVISNTSYADTYSLAVKIAQQFAEAGKSPAVK